MRILFTGAQGFIGRYTTAAALSSEGVEFVTGLGHLLRRDDTFTHEITVAGSAKIQALVPETVCELLRDSRLYKYYSCEITAVDRLREVLNTVQPSVVIHLASTRREEGAAQLIDGNSNGVRALVEACKLHGSVRRIVLGSTGAVYGKPESLPIAETAPCNPADIYGASKLAAEHFGSLLCADASIELVIARIFNVVGPGQEERHLCGRLASQIPAIESGGCAPEIAALGLEAIRDYIDVRDVASALVWLAKRGAAGTAFNLGSGVETSVREVIEGLFDATGRRGRVRTTPRNGPSGVPRHVADVARLAATGFVPRYALRKSLWNVLSYYTRLMTTVEVCTP